MQLTITDHMLTCAIAIPFCHCGLDPQSPLYIVVSGNLVTMTEGRRGIAGRARNDGGGVKPYIR